MKTPHKIIDIVRLGLHSLTVHKGRSVLTALGIIFGVWSVIAMLAINQGASFESQRLLREMGSDNIIIKSVKAPEEEARATSAGRGVLHYGVTHKDVISLADNLPGVTECVKVHRRPKTAHVNGKNLGVTVIATEPTFANVARIDMIEGRFISSADMLLQKPHCVITQSLARRLFDYRDPMGKSIRLESEPFVVVGILSRLPQSLVETADNGGNHVIIPLTTSMRRFGEFTMKWGQGGGTFEKVDVTQVILQMRDDQAVIDGATIARSMLERSHDQRDYEVTVPLELIRQKRAQSRLWNIMFIGIASVSLLVGGIGIMNIMLASVTERTREIGVRRALGAKRQDIIIQFLVESVTLTTAGGIIGIVMGMLIPFVIEATLGLPTIISTLTVALPFVMAVVVGLASGLYPAKRAADLDPIVALRHE